MNETSKIGSGYAEKDANGNLTFVGVLNKYYYSDGTFEAISEPWKAESTMAQYINDYENRVLPNINTRKPLAYFTEDDFVEALLRIKRQNNYTLERMQHYRYIMWRVYNAGVQNNLYEDKIEWDLAKLVGIEDNRQSSGGSGKRYLNKKAFSHEESLTLLKYFSNLKPETARGCDLGLYFMFLFGLRNNEASALDFDSVKLIGETRIPCLIVRQSALQDKRETKAGGKTRNANRLIPIYDTIYDFIMQRRKYVELLVETGEIRLPESNKDVGKLPIASLDDNPCKIVLPKEISKAGKELFKRLNVGIRLMDAAREDIFLQKMQEAEIEEKDITTYVFRRNHATRIRCLGLSDIQRQYLIGHDLEDTSLQRSDFNNEDELLKLKKLIDKHPYNAYLSKKGVSKIIEPVKDMLFCDTESEVCIKLEAGKKYLIKITADEPSCDIKAEIDKNEGIQCNAMQTYGYIQTAHETVNIRDTVLERFLR